ncbi:hypothetical protein BX616_009189, partial [Lobosporangium transversale]
MSTQRNSTSVMSAITPSGPPSTTTAAGSVVVDNTPSTENLSSNDPQKDKDDSIHAFCREYAK